MNGLNKGPILVTGASGGIGAATVRQLVAAGAEVIACGRNVEQLKSPRKREPVAARCSSISARKEAPATRFMSSTSMAL